MGNKLRQRKRLAVVEPLPASGQISLRDRISAIAELGTQALASERCAIAFQPGAAGADEVVCAPHGDSRWDQVLNAILGALKNQLCDASMSHRAIRGRSALDSEGPIERTTISADEIEKIVRVENAGEGHQFAAAAFTAGANTVRIAIVARADRTSEELEASLGLVAGAVLGEIALAGANASLEFWRNHGAENGRQAAGARRKLLEDRAANNYLAEAVAVARRAHPGERFACFGQLVASGSGFDQWVVAVEDGGSFVVAASSSGHKQFDFGDNSALEESYRRHIVIARWRYRDEGAVTRGAQYFEDRMFGGPYVCIPFAAGAIALASRDASASASTAEAIVERLAPLAASWVLERELERRSRLVRQLALRMFAAIDEERAGIARDLHDDQAQLLAAAKIALDGRGLEARSIFMQVEAELRRKTRELRPATLGNTSLDDAVESEFARLNRAGANLKFSHEGSAARISRPVEQICFKVIREALSNVIKHADASSVRISIERTEAAARVSVVDDGRGMHGQGSDGTGLAGLRERLVLMGGSLTLESHAGRTSLVAEIPESV